jgi:hypothetical protein
LLHPSSLHFLTRDISYLPRIVPTLRAFPPESAFGRMLQRNTREASKIFMTEPFGSILK